MRTLRWGMSGEDVADLQRALADFGLFTSEVDGRFGARTRSAVIAFQRSSGLVPDGIAGPRTLAALGLGAPAPSNGGLIPAEAGGAVSLHIGVNRVNPANYGGWSGALQGCEQDASTMTLIAEAEGFAASRLFTRDATSQNVLAAISAAARRLGPGDTFLLTYAGHGSQVPNESDDPEQDQQDETWVLYDRMLLDDELWQAFGAFGSEVNLVLLSDSCHSGTVYRAYSGSRGVEYANVKRRFYENLAIGTDAGAPLDTVPRPMVESAAATGRARVVPQPVRPSSGRSGGVRVLGRTGYGGSGPGEEPAVVQTRELPYEVNQQVLAEHGGEYTAIQERLRGVRDAGIAASLVAISGCQDNQLSQEVNGAGVFTTTLAKVWADDTFTGSYDAFHRAIVAQMAPNQTPDLRWAGPGGEDLRDRTPFNP